jgi:Phage integrase family.
MLKNKLRGIVKAPDKTKELSMFEEMKLFGVKITGGKIDGQEDHERFLELIKVLKESEGNDPHKTTIKPENIPLSTAIENYLLNLEEGENKTKKKTIDKYRSVLRDFLEIVGDVPVDEVDVLTIRSYKKTLRTLPSNRLKMPKYRELNIQELSALDIPKEDLLSDTTIQNIVTNVNSFFNDCLKVGYTKINPLHKEIPKSKAKKNEHRFSFEDKDIKELFGKDEQLKFSKRNTSTYAYWSPVLALYTGARIEEICQLRLESIHLDEDVPFIQIEPYHDPFFNIQLDLKTKYSERKIPLHPDLKKIGFFDFVKGMKELGFYRLFPELTPTDKGFSPRVSKWFTRYKTKHLSCQDIEKKCFHSFRHTVMNKMVNSGIPDNTVEAIVGHSTEGMSKLKESYLKRPDLTILYDAIKILDFGLSKHHKEFKELSSQLLAYGKNATQQDPGITNPAYLLKKEVQFELDQQEIREKRQARKMQ